MRTWPAIEVARIKETGRPKAAPTTAEGAVHAIHESDLFQAALTDYEVAAIDERADDSWRVFFHSAAERDRAIADLRIIFPDVTIGSIDVPDEDWAARSQAQLRSIRIGDIVVAPPWDVESATDSAWRTIVIQPSMGFGTGHHATTRLCLAALQRIPLFGRRVLDVGTGSGVLAIAARMCGASYALGIDDDADAIQSAGENIALNRGVDIEVRVGDLKTIVLTPFDVVLANLTGGLLLHTAARLQELTTATGTLVLSGFMHNEETGVLDAFSQFRIADRTQEDEWVCVVLQREGAFV